MIGVHAALPAPLQNRMDGDQRAVLEDADLVSERMDTPDHSIGAGHLMFNRCARDRVRLQAI